MIAVIDTEPKSRVPLSLKSRVFSKVTEERGKSISLLQRFLARPSIFFSFVFLLTFIQIKWLLRIVSFEPGSFFPYVWVSAFSILSLNISVLAVQAFFGMFVKAPHFQKVDQSEIESVPVALLYCVKNESFGLKERIEYTLKGNLLPNLHLWILSDSSDSFGNEEEMLVKELRNELGREKVFYRRRVVPQERKQGNIKDWLLKWGSPYEYFVVCDADSLLPSGWAQEVVRIAEHPRHSKVGIFQSAIYVAHEASLFSKMQAVAQFYAQRLYFHVNQAVLGRSIAFGHNCLIRRASFQKIELPEGILSHDNWETALLEQKGYKTVYLSNLISFEEAAPHYLEERKRSKRWLKGTLQGWPLLFLPKISFSTRFLIFYQIYLYLVQPILCFWIVSTLLAGPQFFISEGSSFRLFTLTLGVLFFHKMVVARNMNDIKRIIQETLFSTLIGLQNILYGTFDFITIPLQKLGWTPMAKIPGERLSFSECAKSLFIGTLVGAALLWFGFTQSSTWTLFTLPVLLSLILSIPFVYFSSKNLFMKGRYAPVRLKETA